MCSLPSAALDKGFVECNLIFVECLRHSAKNLNPVVIDFFSNEFQPRVLQDPEASAHARQSKRSKGAGPQSHKAERYHPQTSTKKGGSKRGGRSVQETTLDISIESDDYEEFHGQKKVAAHPTSPRDGGQRRRAQDSSISELHENKMRSLMEGRKLERVQEVRDPALGTRTGDTHTRARLQAMTPMRRGTSSEDGSAGRHKQLS